MITNCGKEKHTMLKDFQRIVFAALIILVIVLMITGALG